MVEIQQLKYRVVNARTFRISGSTDTIIAHKDGKNIVSLELQDKIIPLGETVSFSGHTYKVNFIQKKKIKKILYYDLLMAKANASNIFLLPMMGGNKKMFLHKYLVNCFVNYQEYKNKIILVYNHTIETFHKALQKFSNFIKYIRLGGNYKMYIFDPPSKYLEDYNKIIEGKYSQINDTYKLKILDYNDLEIDSAMGNILFKSTQRKLKMERELGIELDENAELFSILDMNLETFDSEYYGF